MLCLPVRATQSKREHECAVTASATNATKSRTVLLAFGRPIWMLEPERRKINLMLSYVHICVPTIPRLSKRRDSSFGLCQSCCQKSAYKSAVRARFGLCQTGPDCAKLVENMCKETEKLFGSCTVIRESFLVQKEKN